MIKISENSILLTMDEYNQKDKINNIIEINENFKMKREYKENKYVFFINFNCEYKEKVKLLRKLKKAKKNGINFGVEFEGSNLIGIINEFDEDIVIAIKAIFIENRDERYEYLYERICDKLDSIWNKENPCKFENNICVYERECAKKPRENGCCYAFWYSKNIFKEIEGVHLCEYLDPEKHCTNRNITCKLFSCFYLKKNFNFRIKMRDILLIQVFFNIHQKMVLDSNFFVKKEELLEKLKKEENNKMELVLYYVLRGNSIYKWTPKDKREIAKKYDKLYKKTNRYRNMENLEE